MILQVKQLQDLPGVQPVGLGRPREDLLESIQLQVVHVVKPLALGLDHPVQWAAVPIIAFHSHCH